jgi:hypothetical protein
MPRVECAPRPTKGRGLIVSYPARFLALLAVGAACTISSCSKGLDLVDAGGKVTYNGSPVAGATVMFAGSQSSTIATTDQDGQFTLVTRGEPGIPPGKYKVTVTKGSAAGGPTPTTDPTKTTIDPEMAEQMAEQARQVDAAETQSELPPKYGDMSTTPLEFEVTTDASKNQFDIPLTD